MTRLQRVCVCLAVAGIIGPRAWSDDRSSDQPQGIPRHAPEVWALTGGQVIERPGSEPRRVTVLIRRDRIAAVGDSIDLPPEARVIDCTDRYIYAGLIDSFTEQPVSDGSRSTAPRYWNDRIRPARRVAADVRNSDSLHQTLRQQGVTARLAAPEGGVVKGFGAVLLTSDQSVEHAILRADVSQHVRLTASRNSDRSYPNSPMGAVALARQAFYDADWYQRAWRAASADSTLPRPERNEDLDALNDVITSRTPLIADTSNELFFLRADRFAREFGLPLIVHGSGHEYRRLDAIRQTGRAVILPVNFPKPPNVSTLEASLDVSTESLLHWDLAPENPARLAEAGVTFSFCSSGLKDKGSFLKQVRTAVARGLAPDRALRALTTDAARLLGIDDQVGTVEPGRLASLAVTSGPLFDTDTKVTECWVAGRRYRLQTPPSRDAVGTWQLTVGSEPDQQPLSLQLQLDRAGENRLSGNIRLADTTGSGNDATPVTLGLAALNETRLSITFRSNDFGFNGVARLTAVLTQDSQQGIGQVVWPDGERVTARLTRRSADAADSTADADATRDEGTDSDEAQDAVAANDTDAAGDSGSEKDADGTQRDAADRDDNGSGSSAPASFPVNYPLGAFGMPTPTAARMPPAGKPDDQARVIALRGGTVWTCGPQGVLSNATILIRDGRFWKIGRRVRIPKNAQVIDITGMHVSPGIIDCHSHFATDGGVNESGQAITAEVRIGDFIDCDDINIYRQLAGGVTTSNILHGSANPIGGQNQVVKLRWGSSGEDMKFRRAPAGIKFALGENVKQSNWGDNFTTRYPQTRMGVEQIFRSAFLEAIHYRHRHERWSQQPEGLPPRRDLELDAIVEILEGKRWIHCHSYRQDEILALIRICDEFHVRIGTFQHILEGYKVADAMAKHGAMGSAFSDWWAYKFEVYDAIPYAGALMHDAGVVVSFNSDDRELARHLNHEAAKAVKYGGVPPEEALKFVTLNPARQLRIDRYVGSIERGKDADLVVWSGPPLSTLSRCEQTWIDGRLYFSRDQDRKLRATNAHIRRTLIQKILDSGEPMLKPGEEDIDPASLWPREDEFCHGHDHRGHGHD